MRIAIAALLLLAGGLCTAAEEAEDRARIFGMRIDGADRTQITAVASFQVQGPPGTVGELRAQVRIRDGEPLTGPDGAVLTRSPARVTVPVEAKDATEKACRVAFRLAELRGTANFPSGESTAQLQIEFSVRDPGTGERIDGGRTAAVLLELTLNEEGEITRVEYLDSWMADLDKSGGEAVVRAAGKLLQCGESFTANQRTTAASRLIPLLADEDFRDEAVDLLRSLDKHATTPLAAGLRSPTLEVRPWCGGLLLRLGTSGRGATLALFDGMRLAIREGEVFTLWTLRDLLADISPKAIGAAEVLSVAIEDPTLRVDDADSGTDTSAVCAAIAALAKLGTAARPAIPILQRALTDPDEKVRQAAKRALNKIPR